MAKKINHCGKNLPVEARYAASNYPGHGDTTYFDYAKCQTCNHSVHNVWTFYFRASKPTPVAQSDKHDRHKYDALINSGSAFIISSSLDEIPRNTRAQILACEWTLKAMNPADQTAPYLKRNETALWVSNVSIKQLEEKRQAWLKEFRRRKLRAGIDVFSF